MIDTTTPRLSSGAIAHLEEEIRALRARYADLTRLAGVEDEAAAYPVRQAIRQATYQLQQAEGLISTNVGRADALRRLQVADQYITEAQALLRQAADGWED